MPTSAPTERKSGGKNADDAERELSQEELAREFSLWMLATLKLEVHDQENGTFSADVPEERRDDLGGRAHLRFVDSPSLHDLRKEEDPELELLAPGSPFFAQILDRLCQRNRVIHSFPRRQPSNVHELTPQLLGAYRFDDGTVHLGGCTLEDRPVIRFTYAGPHPPETESCLRHTYTWPDGRPVPDSMVAALGLVRLVPPSGRRPRAAKADIQRWLQAARDAGQAPESTRPDQPLAESVIWCKYAEGKVVFVSGDKSVEIPFAGWARSFASGSLRPPPFQCDISGRQSYCLATTDDGTITVAESIEACDVSRKRVIHTQLETCAVSGRRVLSEHLHTCPLTDERVLATTMVPCAMCQQRVSPSAVKAGRCMACRRLQRVNKDDTRLARILGEYPGLDRWGRWRLSETSRVCIVVGRSLWRQILAVVDRETLEPRHLAMAGLIMPHWNEIPREQADRYLR